MLLRALLRRPCLSWQGAWPQCCTGLRLQTPAATLAVADVDVLRVPPAAAACIPCPAQELAVALSKYVSEDNPLELIDGMCTGYGLSGAELSDAEISIMPDLINLRIFSNVIYFTGRAMAGEDGIDSLTSRAGAYAKRVRW